MEGLRNKFDHRGFFNVHKNQSTWQELYSCISLPSKCGRRGRHRTPDLNIHSTMPWATMAGGNGKKSLWTTRCSQQWDFHHVTASYQINLGTCQANRMRSTAVWMHEYLQMFQAVQSDCTTAVLSYIRGLVFYRTNIYEVLVPPQLVLYQIHFRYPGYIRAYANGSCQTNYSTATFVISGRNRIKTFRLPHTTSSTAAELLCNIVFVTIHKFSAKGETMGQPFWLAGSFVITSFWHHKFPNMALVYESKGTHESKWS